MDEDGRPVVLRCGLVLSGHRSAHDQAQLAEQFSGPRYLPPAWVQLLGRSSADVADEEHALQLGERADQARAWSDHQADRSGWGR